MLQEIITQFQEYFESIKDYFFTNNVNTNSILCYNLNYDDCYHLEYSFDSDFDADFEKFIRVKIKNK